MTSNWLKAIQYTATTLLVIIAGWAMSFAFNSRWPAVVAVLACSAVMSRYIIGNMIREWRCSRLARKTQEKPCPPEKET